MKKIWKYFLMIISMNVNAQMNLVPNSSFEDMIACPSSTDHVDDCLYWHHVLNSPDYYNVCASYPVSIPSNVFGLQIPYDGNAYMGCHTFASFMSNYREVLGTKLLDTLIPGMEYHVSIRVTRGNWTNDAICITATDKMGIRFTTSEYTLSTPPAINNFAQLYEDTLITDTVNWVLLSWNYIPDSNYSHFYIGNFFTDANTDTLNVGLTGQPYGRGGYYLDSVNIKCTNCPTSIENGLELKQKVVFDNLSCILNIKCLATYEVSIFNYMGELVWRKVIEDSLSLDMKQFDSGIFIIVVNWGSSNTIKKIFIN